MNIICVYSIENYYAVDQPLHSPVDISFGIAIIASALLAGGFTVRMLVLTPQSDMAGIVSDAIMADRPAMFCLTAVTSQYGLIRRVAQIVKQSDPAIRVMLGGHHATLNPEQVVSETSFDAICIGEGERAVVEYARRLLEGKAPDGIHNLWIRDVAGTGVEKNPQDDFIQDLDSLPPINRAIWRDWIADSTREASILLGRGCPNKCSYCSNHALCRIANGRYVRFRSPGSVIDELTELTRNCPTLERVYLEVETLGASLEYTYELCEHLAAFNAAQAKPLRFGTNLALVRKIVANRELLEKLKQANFSSLNIGLESGSERVRQEILRRPRYSNEEIISFCRLAKDVGIDITLYVLIGVPGETQDDFQETIEITRRCAPMNVSLSIFQPYPGTDLYTVARDTGLLGRNPLRSKAERRVAYLDLPGFSRRRIQWGYITFYFKVFRGRRTLADRLAVTFRNCISMYPVLGSAYHKMTGTWPVVGLKRLLGIGRCRP